MSKTLFPKFWTRNLLSQNHFVDALPGGKAFGTSSGFARDVASLANSYLQAVKTQTKRRTPAAVKKSGLYGNGDV